MGTGLAGSGGGEGCPSPCTSQRRGMDGRAVGSRDVRCGRWAVSLARGDGYGTGRSEANHGLVMMVACGGEAARGSDGSGRRARRGRLSEDSDGGQLQARLRRSARGLGWGGVR